MLNGPQTGQPEGCLFFICGKSFLFSGTKSLENLIIFGRIISQNEIERSLRDILMRDKDFSVSNCLL